MTHVLLLLAYSIGVGLVLGGIMRRGARDVVVLAARIAGGMAAAALAIAWVLYLLPA